MYEIVNESNLTILFDMDTQLSLFGAFGIYIKQGNHCCSAIIDVNVNIRMYNFDDVQCTVIPSVAYGFVTGMNLQLC